MEMAQKAGVGERHGVDYGAWARSGLVAGLIAGISFALFEMIVAAVIAGDFFGPLRMISGVVLGQQALTPEVSLGLAAAVGVAVHMVYSLLAGVVFALIIAAVGAFHSSRASVIVTASVLGLLMWILNFYIIAPAAGWSWFPQRASQFWQGFVAHTFLYGSVSGWYLAAARVGK
ncbi:MAG: hypothetical protein ACLFVE_13125, partial [Chitinispirillaceae bacterium]